MGEATHFMPFQRLALARVQNRDQSTAALKAQQTKVLIMRYNLSHVSAFSFKQGERHTDFKPEISKSLFYHHIFHVKHTRRTIYTISCIRRN
jgi:hypothetical protein